MPTFLNSENNAFTITRYPASDNRSLRAWSAADEHILNYLDEQDSHPQSPAIYNDRFGFLTCHLSRFSPFTIVSYKSQEKACALNLTSNGLDVPEFITPLAPLPTDIDVGLVRMPKSIELFRLYLYHLSRHLKKDAVVICAFMTRHFTTRMLDVAGEFFHHVEQSRAWKKSRLLILTEKREFKEINSVNSIQYDDKLFRQYFGVFSSQTIDYASRFLIDHLHVYENENIVLDFGCGNGVLAHAVQKLKPDSDIHLLDDSFLAVESSRLNVTGAQTFFHYNDCLDDFDDNFFDLVVSNPPFHFEYETNIDVSLTLFRETARCLKESGRFLLVANQHLNYEVHLVKIFKTVKSIAKNIKFVIYECRA